MSDTPIDRVIVVGGGVAAQRCAWRLRKLGFAGAVTVVSAESQPAYDRTALSKDLLRGDARADQLLLRTVEDYDDMGIDLLVGTRAAALDPAGSRVLLASGRELPYDRVVVCTGGVPVLPRALVHPRAHVVRDIADAERLRAELLGARRLAVIGGGVLGGEVAAAAATMGVEAMLIEAFPEPMAGVLGREVGARIRALHEAHGVRVLTGSAVAGIRGDGAELEVELAGGPAVQVDAVVVAVGMRPAVEWLAGSGIRLDDGIVTDAFCRTSLPNVLAAGDCARWHHQPYGTHLRVEHWDTACRHGEAAAAAAIGAGDPFSPVPFWWTDVHGVKLQFAGRCAGWERVDVEDGASPHTFSARYRRAGELLAVVAIDQPRVVAEGRRHLESHLKERSLVA